MLLEGRKPGEAPELLVRDPEDKLPWPQPCPCGEKALPKSHRPFLPHSLHQAIYRASVLLPGLVHHPGLHHVSRAAQRSGRKPGHHGCQRVRDHIIPANPTSDDRPFGLVIASQLPHVHQESPLNIWQNPPPEPSHALSPHDLRKRVCQSVVPGINQATVRLHPDLNKIRRARNDLQ